MRKSKMKCWREIRTLKEQKEEAEKNGDVFLARLFNRMPEQYIGLISCKEEDNPEFERLKKLRSLKKQQFDLVMKLDALTKEEEENEVKDAILLSSTNAKNLMESEEYKSEKFLSQYLQEVREKMMTAVSEVNKWKRVIISLHDAKEQAKLEYMSKVERELWLNYSETQAQKKHLEDFLLNLHKPKESQKETLKAYDELVAGINTKIESLDSAARLLQKSVEEIEKRLETPDCKKNILLVTHQILQANTQARKMLKMASEKLDTVVNELTIALANQTEQEPKNIYKTREVYNLIRHHLSSLKKEYEQTLDEKYDIQQRVISLKRAIAMAQNIFVHGDYKRLREGMRRYKKAEQRLTLKLLDFTQREKMFLSRKRESEERTIFLQEQYELTKEKTLLEIEQRRLSSLKDSLDRKQTELELLCQKPASKEKIDLIASGILRKNYKFVCRLEEIESRAKQLVQKIRHAKDQVEILKFYLTHEKHDTSYRVAESVSQKSAASVIADALMREAQAVQLVARSSGNGLEMETSWELMSELDKDELIHKKILREL